MKNINEIRDYLLENRIDSVGDLDLSDLDFSDFNGNIFIGGMKVNGCLYQGGQEVNGDLWQDNQAVQRDLHQDYQVVKGLLFQTFQKASKYYLQDTTELIKEKDYYVNKFKIKVSKEIYSHIAKEFLDLYETEE